MAERREARPDAQGESAASRTPLPEVGESTPIQTPFDQAIPPDAGPTSPQPMVRLLRAAGTASPVVGIPGYDILGVLGRGGMGVVYQARHLANNRLVALKMILAGLQAGTEDLVRFLTEAEALARLQHPNIVQIYEVGQHNGQPFIALEFVDGVSLARQLDGQPQPPREAAVLLETLARAVHCVHQQGINHRDLKPGNILLRRQSEIPNPKSETNPKIETPNPKPGSAGVSDIGDLDLGFVSDFGFRVSDFEAKVTDFGLAKRLFEADASLTPAEAVLGTPSYMARGRARGKRRLRCGGRAADISSGGASCASAGPAARRFAAPAGWRRCNRSRPPARRCRRGSWRPGCRAIWKPFVSNVWKRSRVAATPARWPWPTTCAASSTAGRSWPGRSGR